MTQVRTRSGPKTSASSHLQGARALGAILWPSFFAAGVATMCFFAAVDPIELAAITWPRVDASRELGYTIGFFMFWLCTASASFFTALLLRPPSIRQGTPK
jgi:hypothetical protein